MLNNQKNKPETFTPCDIIYVADQQLEGKHGVSVPSGSHEHRWVGRGLGGKRMLQM